MTQTARATVGVVARILDAKSIAIIGASEHTAKPTGRVLRYLARYGFSGVVYPINPSRDTVQSLQAYRSVAEIPAPADLAIIAVPAEQVENAVRECARAGITLVVVFSSGFAEVGGDGAELQARLTDVARETGTRIIGPNSVGVVSARQGLSATFMTALDQNHFDLRDDGIAFVSQSGAMGGYVLSIAASSGLGIGSFFSTGNEADVGLSELLLELAEDDRTRVLLAYVEGVRDGAAFERSLSTAAERGIPTIVMKVGRSERGAKATASHTGALAGSDAVIDGVLRRHGAFRADDVESMVDLARVFAGRKRAAGNRVTIVTVSGGAGALMTDYAAELGLEVPEWTDEWQARIKTVIPDFGSATNPIDTTGVVGNDPRVLIDALELALAHDGSDIVMCVLGNFEAEERMLIEGIRDVASRSSRPLLVTWLGGSGAAETRLWKEGVPTYTDPLRAMRAAAALAKWAETGDRPYRPDPPGAPLAVDHLALDRARVQGRTALDEVAAKSLLAQAGIPVTREEAVTSTDDAVAAAERIGYPVVAKILSDEVNHKSDVGGVRVGIPGRDALRENVSELLALGAQLGLSDRRVVIQEFVNSQTEIIVGMTQDATFGPAILVGIGGVLTELAEDVQIRPAPVTQRDALEMIGGLRNIAGLQGARGRTAVDLEALATVVADFSRLCLDLQPGVTSIEINPLLVRETGRVVAADALVLLAPGSDEEEGELL